MATPVKGKFHSQCGRFVSLSLDRERAALAKNISRNQPLNYVMVYSDRPLRDGQLFQVKFEQTSLIVRGLVIFAQYHCIYTLIMVRGNRNLVDLNLIM